MWYIIGVEDLLPRVDLGHINIILNNPVDTTTHPVWMDIRTMIIKKGIPNM
jgi:hypothetical protein